MKLLNSILLTFPALALLTLNACSLDGPELVELKQGLGEKLFNDAGLSKDGTQSCASCHDAAHAFIDPRINASSVDGLTPGAVSEGQDSISLGDINTPSAAYTAFVPEFRFDDAEGLFIGGMFLDGRAANLQEQAKHPFLNELEMQSTEQAVVDKVQTAYGDDMRLIYGDDIFEVTENAFEAIADSIAEFEKTDQFATFDSKFDQVLAGQTQLSTQEQQGLDLFLAEDKGNCAACHPVPEPQSSPEESLFTDFSYDNLGVPTNRLVRSVNGKSEDFIDTGLLANPDVEDSELQGAFRVSSLRNIAVTAPYMHNGFFRDLESVVHFYNSRDVAGALNPETGAPWQAAENDATKNSEELGDLGLNSEEVSAIVACLKTLTDEKYQSLMPED